MLVSLASLTNMVHTNQGTLLWKVIEAGDDRVLFLSFSLFSLFSLSRLVSHSMNALGLNMIYIRYNR